MLGTSRTRGVETTIGDLVRCKWCVRVLAAAEAERVVETPHDILDFFWRLANFFTELGRSVVGVSMNKSKKLYATKQQR